MRGGQGLGSCVHQAGRLELGSAEGSPAQKDSADASANWLRRVSRGSHRLTDKSVSWDLHARPSVLPSWADASTPSRCF